MTRWQNDFIQAVSEHAAMRGIGYISLSNAGARLELWIEAGTSAGPSSKSELRPIKAFAPGIFRHVAGDAAPLQVGAVVEAGTRLGWLETGDFLFDVKAGVSGVLESFDASDGEVAGYGKCLATIRA